MCQSILNNISNLLLDFQKHVKVVYVHIMEMVTSLAVVFRSFTKASHVTRAFWMTRRDDSGAQHRRTMIKINCLDTVKST